MMVMLLWVVVVLLVAYGIIGLAGIITASWGIFIFAFMIAALLATLALANMDISPF